MPTSSPYPTKGLRKLAYDLFMGPDGETWAFGRFSAVPVLASGLAAPFYLIFKGSPISLTELGALLVATAGAVTTLLRFTNHIDNPIAGAPQQENTP